MEKEYLFLILFYGVFFAIMISVSMLYQPSFDSGYENIVIENVSFVSFSGEPSNSVVVYLRNTGAGNIVLDHVNVTCSDWEKEFSIDPEESRIPVDVSRSVVLFNVGWITGQVYKINVYTSSGQLVGAFQATV